MFSALITYLIISLIFASLFKPIVTLLSGFRFLGVKIPRALAILLTFTALFFFLGLLVNLYAPLMKDQLDKLAHLDIRTIIFQLEKPIRDLESFLNSTPFFNIKRGTLIKTLYNSVSSSNLITSKDIGYFLNGFLEVTGSLFTGLLAVTFITFFLLLDQGILKRTFLKQIPNKYFELIVSALFKAEKQLSNYMLGLFVQLFSIFTLTSIGLSLIGYPYAITVAVFSALVNVVPYIGPILGTLVALVLGLSAAPLEASANDYFWILANIGIVYTIVHLIDNVISQPLIFSRSVKAHPLEIFVAIFAGAAVAGVVGMVLALPVFTIARVVYNQIIKGYGQYSLLGRKTV